MGAGSTAVGRWPHGSGTAGSGAEAPSGAEILQLEPVTLPAVSRLQRLGGLSTPTHRWAWGAESVLPLHRQQQRGQALALLSLRNPGVRVNHSPVLSWP